MGQAYKIMEAGERGVGRLAKVLGVKPGMLEKRMEEEDLSMDELVRRIAAGKLMKPGDVSRPTDFPEFVRMLGSTTERMTKFVSMFDTAFPKDTPDSGTGEGSKPISTGQKLGFAYDWITGG